MKRVAELYRMETKDHICPYGLRSKNLLEKSGFEVKDNIFRTREEVEAFKSSKDVKTTPQTYIDGKKIGGYESLVSFLNEGSTSVDKTSYRPIQYLFSMTLLMAIGYGWRSSGQFLTISTIEMFVALSMCMLATLKLQDLESFVNQFITYDLIGMKQVRYAFAYPFIEGLAGISMISGLFTKAVGPIVLLVGLTGFISVFKAVYVDKRELKCACVGGNSSVPLGFISLTENIFMIAMGIWMFVKANGVG